MILKTFLETINYICFEMDMLEVLGRGLMMLLVYVSVGYAIKDQPLEMLYFIEKTTIIAGLWVMIPILKHIVRTFKRIF